MAGITVVDTDILIDAGRGVAQAVNFLAALEKQGTVAISVVTQMELMVGCQNKRELQGLGKFLQRFYLLKLDEAVTDEAVKLLEQYRLSHGLLIPDALIAATAIR
ncbi:MAG TPA: type II toxin-antitoxin system VapC family toxin [Chloroflexota bacterium]|nr:type II toxin-antitoxin system VapC family toxin [Chloroflexota bacterium]HUM69785.1 type II toxin-antitoxin system VapC family toxin [Chloroflexota bacterium]